jgi:hypothetical protein
MVSDTERRIAFGEKVHPCSSMIRTTLSPYYIRSLTSGYQYPSENLTDGGSGIGSTRVPHRQAHLAGTAPRTSANLAIYRRQKSGRDRYTPPFSPKCLRGSRTVHRNVRFHLSAQSASFAPEMRTLDEDRGHNGTAKDSERQ